MFTNLIKSLDQLGARTGSKRAKNNNKTKSRSPVRKGFESWTRRRMETAALPAAYATHVRSRFSTTIRGDEVRISGCDLVYNIPSTIVSGAYTLFTVIPANPAYWDGTRVAQLAPAYMNYRPIRVSFHYIPQVAVTQPGTVFMGTLWNGAPAGDNIQQTLVTSNGGCLTQCYIPADTVIKLGDNLQQNLFTMNGSLNPDTSPFVFVAGVAGASVTPGYFYVDYEYAFKNPIGQSWIYDVQPSVAASSISSQSGVNQSVLLLQPAAGFGAGTIFDSESNGLFYRGSPVTLAEETMVAIFSNRQGGAAIMRARDATPAYEFDVSSWIEGTGGQFGVMGVFTPASRALDVYDTLTTTTVPVGSLYTTSSFTIPPCNLSGVGSDFVFSAVVPEEVQVILPQ